MTSFLLMSCQSIFGQNNSQDRNDEDTTIDVAEATSVPAIISDPDRDIVPNRLPETLPPSAITLTLWTTERFSTQNPLFTEQLNQFEEENPDVMVEVILKRTSGQASALNFLKSAQLVAPAILPDIVVLSTDDLPQAWRNKLIQPLDHLVAPTLQNDLNLAAQRLGTVDGNLVGIPYEINVEHIAYNASKVITAPLAWTDVLSRVNQYQFRASGQNGLLNDALLIQYLSAGAKLVDEQGIPIIDEPVLRDLLNYYQSLVQQGIVVREVVDPTFASQIWDNYLANNVEVAHVNANQYLADRRFLVNAQVGPIPSRTDKVTSIGHGWALSLVTTDEFRQAAAINLIHTFLLPENNAAWATAVTTVPTRNSVLTTLGENDAYWHFLRNYLDTASAPPNFSGYDQLSRILLIAIQQVINEEATPEEAIATAKNALTQLTP